jgi:hypothetical protein
LDPGYIEEFRGSLLSPEDFQALQTKIELLPEADAPFVAEDGQGHTYSYGTETLHLEHFEIDAQGWLGIEAQPGTW